MLRPCHPTMVRRFSNLDFTLQPRDHLSLSRRTPGVVFSPANRADEGPPVYCPTKSFTGCAAVRSLIRIMTGTENSTLNICSMNISELKHKDFMNDYCYRNRTEDDCELNQ